MAKRRRPTTKTLYPKRLGRLRRFRDRLNEHIRQLEAQFEERFPSSGSPTPPPYSPDPSSGPSTLPLPPSTPAPRPPRSMTTKTAPGTRTHTSGRSRSRPGGAPLFTAAGNVLENSDDAEEEEEE